MANIAAVLQVEDFFITKVVQEPSYPEEEELIAVKNTITVGNSLPDEMNIGIMPEDDGGGGPAIPTSGVIWWQR